MEEARFIVNMLAYNIQDALNKIDQSKYNIISISKTEF